MFDADHTAVFDFSEFMWNVTELPQANLTRDDVDDCYTYPMTYLEEQFYLVTIFGSGVAFLSIVQNIILLYMFLTRKFFRRSYFFYFSILASFDLLHSVAYILVFGVCVFFEYTENLAIMRIWFSYAVYAVGIAGVLRTTSVLILVAASIERYLYANDLAGFCSNRRRSIGIFVLFLIALVTKGMVIFEMEVQHRPNCTGLKEYILVVSDLVQNNPLYATVWAFWVRSILTIFIPFLLLIVLNLLVLYINRCSCFDRDITAEFRLRYRRGGVIEADKSAECDISNVNSGILHSKTDRWVTKARSRVRKAATRTFIIIILESVIASGFSVLISAWEHIDAESLTQFDAFYTFANDFVSILSVLPCAIRLPTYWICDVTFRKELHWALCKGILFRTRRRRRPLASEEGSSSRLLIPLRKSVDGIFTPRTRPERGSFSFGEIVLLAMEKERSTSGTPVPQTVFRLDSGDSISSPTSTMPLLTGESSARPKQLFKQASLASNGKTGAGGGMRGLVQLALQKEREAKMNASLSEQNMRNSSPRAERASKNQDGRANQHPEESRGENSPRPDLRGSKRGTSRISFADIL